MLQTVILGGFAVAGALAGRVYLRGKSRRLRGLM
jgi:hypothetical protein